ncbi:hypothetical protein FJTKL_12425 [Diaporthe vaccinii]|uniref:Uncharacterized protein n=1 Tax=Diaporthe vaccinii TaxID=105482 RepID=A0ABR4EDW6_9PEZI
MGQPLSAFVPELLHFREDCVQAGVGEIPFLIHCALTRLHCCWQFYLNVENFPYLRFYARCEIFSSGDGYGCSFRSRDLAV